MLKPNYIFPVILAALMVLPGVSHGAPLTKKDPAPSFIMKTLKGKEVTLSDYRGKYLLLNFWATWCAPCKIEMPSLETLYNKFKSTNFDIIAVSNDIFGAKVVKPFVDTYNMTFTVSLDQDLKISNTYGVSSLPTTFLIDPKGNILGVLNGAEDWANAETLAWFEKLLNQP